MHWSHCYYAIVVTTTTTITTTSTTTTIGLGISNVTTSTIDGGGSYLAM